MLLSLTFIGVLSGCGVATHHRSATDQRDADEFVVKGVSALRKGDLAEARSQFLVAEELYPSAMTADALGCVLFQEERYQEAEGLFVKAVKRDPEYSFAYGNLATLYDRANRSDLAEPLYRKALVLNPKNFRARNNYSVHLVAKGRKKEASRELAKAKVVVTDTIIESNIKTLRKE